MNEYDVVRELKDRLMNQVNGSFKNIWINKRLSNNKYIINEYEFEFGYKPVLQPEIDMIFLTHNNELNAVEVKYLKRKNNGYNFSYYFGIGQALSLCRFGFYHVGLWLIIDESVPNEEVNTYGSSAWRLIRNELKLNLEYSYFRKSEKNGKHYFNVMQYEDKNKGFKITDNISDPNFKITWKYHNPMSCFKEPKFMRRLIEKYVL